jgi:hypothetical protein
MISVECPRCGKVWYSDDRHGGKVRLCSDCVAKLRGKRRGSPFRLDAFAVVALVLILLDVVLIALTQLFPESFGMFDLVFGSVLCFLGLMGLRACMRGGWYLTDVDWEIARWPLLLALIGLSCVLTYVSLVLPQR